MKKRDIGLFSETCSLLWQRLYKVNVLSFSVLIKQPLHIYFYLMLYRFVHVSIVSENTPLTLFSASTCLLWESHNCSCHPLDSFNYFQVIILIKLIFCTLVFDCSTNNQTHKLIHTRTQIKRERKREGDRLWQRVKISLGTLLQEKFQGVFLL